MQLEPQDQKRLLAAEGFLQLGMFLDAIDELEALPKNLTNSIQVLALWIEAYQGLKKWGEMQAVAHRLAEVAPENVQWAISWAYATRRAESIPAAREILLEAMARHPKEPLIYYNLACYDCQLGELSSARGFLERALKMAPNFRRMALEDDDLRPLHSELT